MSRDMNDRSPGPPDSRLKGPERIAAPPWRLVFLAAFLLAFPFNEPDLGGLGFSLAWAGVCAAGIAMIVRRKLILAGTVAICFGLAYGQGFGHSLVAGVERAGIHASAGAAQLAALMLVVFLAGLVAVAGLVRDWLARRLPHAPGPVPPSTGLDLGLFAFFALSFLAALQTGFWTFWGSGDNEMMEAGGFRLELFYAPVLFATSCHLILRPWPTYRPPRPWPAWLPRLLIGLVLVALLFLLQSRRIMAACGSIALLAWFTRPRAATSRHTSTTLRLVGVLALFAAMMTASAGWRAVGGGDDGLGDRLQQAATTVGDADSLAMLENRLTYLWVDALTTEMHHGHHTSLDFVELAKSQLAYAVPTFLFPGKADLTPTTCESAFKQVGLTWDLPCTPTTEGWLIAEWLGILMAIFLWGVPIGIAEYLAGSSRGLSSFLGFMLLFRFTLIETGLFAVVDGLRNVAVSVLLAGGVMLAWALLTRLPTRGRTDRAP